jgi:hypothetical protein
VLTRLVKLMLLTNTEIIKRKPKSPFLSDMLHQISVFECREVSMFQIPLIVEADNHRASYIVLLLIRIGRRQPGGIRVERWQT